MPETLRVCFTKTRKVSQDRRCSLTTITPFAEHAALPSLPPAPVADLRLLEEVSAATAGVSRLEMCIQCGTCGGACPSAADMDHTPRALFAMIRAGMRDEVLHSNTPWFCVSCYHCVVRCPQEVHIADVMYTLKSMAVRAKRYKANTTAANF